LLTSAPAMVTELLGEAPRLEPRAVERWSVRVYRTFDELRELLEQGICRGHPDAVVHSAAVSDYEGGGFYAPAPGTTFNADSGCWRGAGDAPPALLPQKAGKVKSTEPELWLRLARAPKLIDLMRPAWGFRGVLVKFKLEVGLDEESLRQSAEESRRQSGADL